MEIGSHSSDGKAFSLPHKVNNRLKDRPSLAGDARAENHPEDNTVPHLSDNGPAATNAWPNLVRRDFVVRSARVQVQAAGAPARHLREREAVAALLRHRSVPGGAEEQGGRRGRFAAAAAAAAAGGRHACSRGGRALQVTGGHEEGQQRLSPLALALLPLREQPARPPARAPRHGQRRPRGDDGQARDGGVERGDIEATGTGDAEAHHTLQIHHKRRHVR